MADAGIKKVTILKSDIEAIAGASQGYILRYRVVSEDKNRTSHWSPQYKLNVTALNPIANPRPHVVTVANGVVNCVWEQTKGLSSEKYDVYLKWTVPEIPPAVEIPDVWEYITTTPSPSFSTVKRSGATKVQVAVQVPTFPKQRFTGSTLFESIEYSV